MNIEDKLDNLTNDTLLDNAIAGYDRFVRVRKIYYTRDSGHTWRRWLND